MKYLIEITDKQTNETKYIQESVKKDDSFVFGYAEGNFSCDCNRYIMFYNDIEYDCPCGETRFEVNIYDAETGKQLLKEENGYSERK